MKKIIFVMALFIVSCSKSDDNDNSNGKSLVAFYSKDKSVDMVVVDGKDTVSAFYSKTDIQCGVSPNFYTTTSGTHTYKSGNSNGYANDGNTGTFSVKSNDCLALKVNKD